MKKLELHKLRKGMLIKGYISGSKAVFLKTKSFFFEEVIVFNCRKQKTEKWIGSIFYKIK